MPSTLSHLTRHSVLLTSAAAATLAAAGLRHGESAVATARLPIEGRLPSFAGATAWLNSGPLTAADLRGKVALVSFWNFTCINWLRERPYVRGWAERYKDKGLVVIGVHAPEFAFEKNIDDVHRDIRDAQIGYPIAVDNDHAIWRAFNNRYWPALYFVDAQGRIRHHQFGEGGYEQAEEVIRQLLAEARSGDVGPEPAALEARGAEVAADWTNLKSPETYIGYGRTENFASPGGVREDVPSLYRVTSPGPRNWWSLGGVWTVGEEFATAGEKSGRITYRFHARDLHLVLAPATPGRPVRFRIKVDGAAPGADHGVDAEADGSGVVQDGRLYQLVRQTGAVADRTFEIEFLDPGVRAYAFTFG